MHGRSESVNPLKIQIRPTGGVFISWVLGDPLRVHFSDSVYDRQPRFFIGGQLRHEQPVLESLGRFELVGMELTPTAFFRLYGRDTSMLTDGIMDYGSTFPDHTAWLERHTGHTPDAHDAMSALGELVMQLAKTSVETPVIDAVVADIVSHDGIVKIAELASRHGIKSRALHRQFLRTVGLPPKNYAKIVQINTVIRALVNEDFERLQMLSVEHGYFDHAHFIRDFKRFVGMNPSHFLASGSEFLRTYLGNASR